ncbi:MAG: hypothetical protein M3Y08_16150 [Fibrobacterota bacterium]|nr:hypothetical protein [Fibrobacterota bacterium]
MEPKKPAEKGPAAGGSAAQGTAAQGACDHFQPADLTRLAEEYLNGKAIPPDRWEGSRFGYGAGGGTGPFKAVITEVERKKGNWVVVRLDRRKEELAPDNAGFKVVRDAD